MSNIRHDIAREVLSQIISQGHTWFNKGWKTDEEMYAEYAKEAYGFADAMLKEGGLTEIYNKFFGEQDETNIQNNRV